MQNTKGFGHGAAPKADVISFNTAISACEKASAWQTAMLLFLEMENLQYLSRFERQRKQKAKIIYSYFKLEFVGVVSYSKLLRWNLPNMRLETYIQQFVM